MNNVCLMGRLARDPEVRYGGQNNSMAIARYVLAVDRGVKRDPNNPNQQTADFISCQAFGNNAKFTEQYLKKGTKIALEGRIQTGRYVNKDGVTVYTTDVVVNHQEFAENKGANGAGTPSNQNSAQGNDPFVNFPNNGGEDLPFR